MISARRRLTDFYGNTLMEARAPKSGMILVLVRTPPINAGETLSVIAMSAPPVGRRAATARPP